MGKLSSAYMKAFEQSEKNNSNESIGQSNSVIAAEVEAKNSVDDAVVSRHQISKMTMSDVFTSKEMAEKRLIHSKMEDTNTLNTFRDLRTKLLSITGKSNFVTLVTSVVPHAGSSMVAANLGCAFALDQGKTSLLVDANIHSPALTELLEIGSGMGLIDYLESMDLDLNKVIHKTGIPRLRLLPGGNTRENTSEYFTSFRMRHLIEEVISRYEDRYPIIDAPCILKSADTRILAQLCTQVILVVPYGMCSENDIKKAARAIGKDKLAGIVLNQF